MSRPVSAVHVDIARFVLEVSMLSAESTESTDKKVADWTRGLMRCLAMRDPTLHPYGAHLLSEVEEYRKADIERKRAKFSKDSVESKETLPRTDQNKAKQSNKEQKKNKSQEGASRFTPPTLAEVRAYCIERGNSVDPEKFIAHYESNGWRVGRNPMKAWKSAIITWEKGNQYGTGSNGARPHLGKSEKNSREFSENLTL